VNHTVDQSNTNLVSWPKSTLLTLRKHRAQAGERIPVLVLASVPLVIVVILLLIIGLVAFQVQDHLGIRTYGLGNFRQLYTDPFVYNSFINTAIVSAVSLGVAFGFGIPIAWLVERTNLPARGLVFPLFTINLLVPSFFTAMGWVILFHQRIGVVNKALMALLPIDQSPLNIVSVVGMGVVEGFALAPLAFIMIAASFRALDPTLDECARVHGISFLTRLRKITIPLMKPSIMGAAIFVLAITVAAFDIPATIGLSNRIYTFSTFVYTTAFPPETPPNYGLVAASSSVMLIIGFFLTWRYMVVIGQSHKYAVVRGKDYRLDLIDLGRWSILGWSIIGLVLLLNMVLPLLALVWASLTPFLQVPSVSAFQMMSLDNFRLVPWSQFMTSLRNSVILFFSVPTITTVFGLAISWVVIRSKWRIGHTFDVLAFLPHVIPNLILAVGAFLLVIHWFPTQFGLFERTIGIIMLVYVVTRISFSTRMLNSGLLQIHEELDEAGYVAGLGPVEVIRKILIPLLSATLLYSWLWMALLAFRELTVAAFLASRGNLTLPVTIWSIWNNGQLNQAAAAALVFVGLLTPLIILYFAFGRRRISVPQ
jgi:iron(III) transport system permease protein